MSSADQGQGWTAPGECHEGRCGEEPANGDELQRTEVTDAEDSSPANRGITLEMSSRGGESLIEEAVGARSIFPPSEPSPSSLWIPSLDWIEVRGRITWSRKRESRFAPLAAALERAKETRDDQEVTLGDRELYLRPESLGRGRQPRLPYHFRWGDVVVGFADREAETRQQSNFYCNVPGRACLIRGAIEALEASRGIVEFLGGVIVDEWFQRVDLCVDMPGVEFQRDILPSLSARHFLTTAKRWHPHDGPHGPTGFSVISGNLHLRIYNKLLLVSQKSDEEVLRYMIAKRWHNEIPPCATRVEIEIYRAAQHRVGLETTHETLQRVPDMVDKYLGKGPYPYFQLLAGEVDRTNKHQSRATMHPLWAEMIERMAKISGQRDSPLRTLPRSSITGKHEVARIVNGLVRVAASTGRIVVSQDDLVEVLQELCRRNLIEDSDIEAKSMKETRRRGVLDDVLGFNPSSL